MGIYDHPLPIQTSAPNQFKVENPLYVDADYKMVGSNWYAAKPYGFRYTPKSGNQWVMYLPINPSNLSITTHFATNLIPTIYGTVEEHSPVRYHDIVIEGTTGMVPKFPFPLKATENVYGVVGGRKAFSIKVDLSLIAGGFFSKTLGAVDKTISSAKNFLFGEDQMETGVKLDQTGYLAFHNLYRFLLKYKKDVAGIGIKAKDERPDTTPRDPKLGPPLVFFNYKDNNEYSVVVKSFTLRRDKENPMLYYYNISLRGYDLKQINIDNNILGKVSSSDMLAHLGLDSVKGAPILTQIKEKANHARDVLATVGNGINQLGR